MESLNRRQFGQLSLSSLMTYSLLETLFQRDLFAGEIKPVAIKWAARLNELSQDLKGQKLTQQQWQQQIEALYAQADLPEVLRLVDFDKVKKNELVDNGARSIRFELPEVEGLPKQLVFGKQIFGLKKDRSVVPHGHNNMATAFLMLQGECHGRHYDRLEDHEDHYIIKPTIDRQFKAAEYSSVSDYKDNVHWFKATSETAYIFNIHVLNVQPGGTNPTGRVYMDPNGEKLQGGLIKAPKLGYKEVNELYG